MATTVRKLNEKDRAFLKNRADALDQAGSIWGELSDFFFLGFLPMSVFAQFGWNILCRLLGIFDPNSGYLEQPIVFCGAIAIFLLTTIFYFRDFNRVVIVPSRVSKLKRELIKKELEVDQVEATDSTVVGLKCLQDPEHLMKIYLFKLLDGRIWVLYDYDSVDLDGKGKSRRTNFVTSTEMQFVQFKHLGETNYVFGGSKIRKPRAIVMTVKPPLWPEDETWLELDWDRVEETYGK